MCQVPGRALYGGTASSLQVSDGVVCLSQGAWLLGRPLTIVLSRLSRGVECGPREDGDGHESSVSLEPRPLGRAGVLYPNSLPLCLGARSKQAWERADAVRRSISFFPRGGAYLTPEYLRLKGH